MQSNLTTALIVLAVLVLMSIGLHGFWRARKLGARLAAVDDEQSRREPSLDDPATVAPEGGCDVEPSLEQEPLSGLSEASSRPMPLRRSVKLDALIDAIATVSVEVPVLGESALPHVPGSNRAGTKPFYIEGLNAETGLWESIAATARYSEFQAGVQMANRHGPLNEIEFSEFVQKVETFAQGMGAISDLPDMLETVARARELDTFAGQHDVQLVVILRTNMVAWSLGYLQQCAQRHGFVPSVVSGRLVLAAAEEGAPPVVVLSFDGHAALAEDPAQSGLREFSLGFDVAQTEEAVEPFAAWHSAARALAEDLDASIVDDQGQELTLQAFSAIHAQLRQLYEALATRDLSAGSPSARRLFS